MDAADHREDSGGVGWPRDGRVRCQRRDGATAASGTDGYHAKRYGGRHGRLGGLLAALRARSRARKRARPVVAETERLGSGDEFGHSGNDGLRARETTGE